MVKNIIIVVLVVFLIAMFIANYKNVKALVEETKKRVNHQMSLTNLLETSSSSTEKPITSTGATPAVN